MRSRSPRSRAYRARFCADDPAAAGTSDSPPTSISCFCEGEAPAATVAVRAGMSPGGESMWPVTLWARTCASGEATPPQ